MLLMGHKGYGITCGDGSTRGSLGGLGRQTRRTQFCANELPPHKTSINPHLYVLLIVEVATVK